MGLINDLRRVIRIAVIAVPVSCAAYTEASLQLEHLHPDEMPASSFIPRVNGLPFFISLENDLNRFFPYREWKKFRREQTYGYSEPFEIGPGEEDYFFRVLETDVPYEEYGAHGEPFREALIHGFGETETPEAASHLARILADDKFTDRDKNEAGRALKQLQQDRPDRIRLEHMKAVAHFVDVSIYERERNKIGSATLKDLILMLGDSEYMPALDLLIKLSRHDYGLYADAADSALVRIPHRRATYRLLEVAKENHDDKNEYLLTERVFISAKRTGMLSYVSKKILELLLDFGEGSDFGKVCEKNRFGVDGFLEYASEPYRSFFLGFDGECPSGVYARTYPYNCNCAITGRTKFWLNKRRN